MTARLFSTTALVALISTPLIAQDAAYLGEVTLSANTSVTDVKRSGSTVEVVTREELQKSGETRVVDYLTKLPGISVTANGGIGTTTSLRIRGSSGRYIAVYVDGIDVNDPSAPQIAFDFGSLMASDISRIEVLKGAQSALYGSEAIAGVINITTNGATEPGTHHSINAEYGSYNTSRLSYNLSHRAERGGVSLTVSHVRTDGFSAADENNGNDEADGHETRRISFSSDYALTDQATIGLAGFWQESWTEYDEYSFPAGPVDGATPDELSEGTSHGLRAFLRYEGERIEHEFAISAYRNDRLSSGTNAWGPFKYDYLGERTAFTYKGVATLSETFRLGFGADYTEESYKSGSNKGVHYMTGVFIEADWTPSDQLDVAATLRYDDHSIFGSKTTGRVAAAYRPREDVILRFAAGTGFRTPSLFELFDPRYGNPALKPETSSNVELGAEKLFANGGFARLTLFRTEITDLIQWSGGSYKQVSGTGYSQGVELSGAMPLNDRITLNGNLTYTDAQFSNGNRLTRVPEWYMTLGIDAQVTDKFRVGATAQRSVNMIDGTKRLPDYTVVNATMSYDFTDTVQGYLRIDNLFDEEYQTVRGYGTSDRAAYVGLRASF